MKIMNTSKDKNLFYGFRKAFIKNNTLPLEARFLLILLMTYKGKNKSCWPSIGEISKRMGKNRDTVRKYLIVLETSGHLIIESRGIGRSHLYSPSYIKISSGITNINETTKPAEKYIYQPNESTLNRSINSGNKEKDFISGKDLFLSRKKQFGLI